MTVEGAETLGGRYQLEERIATGGMGQVWRAGDLLLGRQVAVKILKQEYADDPSFLDRFRAEARHTAGLSHPGIATVYDYGEVDSTSYLVMELVAGQPLSQVLAETDRLEPERALEIVVQAAHALAAAHDTGVIHRDVKPGNILVRPDGVVKVTDFGIARAADTLPLTQTGTVLGTAHYLSPEQGTGRPVTPASDVYSLGVVTYECVAGRRPFHGDNAVTIAFAHVHEEPPPLPDDVPAPLRQLVERAMAKDPAQRFADAAAFAEAATAVQERLTGAAGSSRTVAMAAMDDTAAAEPAAPAGSTAILRKQPAPGRRSRAVWLVPLVLLVLVLGGVAAFMLAGGNQPPVAVPSVRQLKLADAKARLAQAGLDVKEEHTTDTRVPAGTVSGQRPAPGAMLAKGDAVTVVVSDGPPEVRIPNLIDMFRSNAKDTLEKLGLRVKQKFVLRRDVREGKVVDYTPKTGVRKGDEVTITVAYGGSDGDDDEEEEDKDGRSGGKGKGKG